MKNKYPNISTHANDLLGIGKFYWLGGSSNSKDSLWSVFSNCAVFSFSEKELGIRPVVSLKSGIQIAEDNEGTGLSIDSVIQIAD